MHIFLFLNSAASFSLYSSIIFCLRTFLRKNLRKIWIRNFLWLLLGFFFAEFPGGSRLAESMSKRAEAKPRRLETCFSKPREARKYKKETLQDNIFLLGGRTRSGFIQQENILFLSTGKCVFLASKQEKLDSRTVRNWAAVRSRGRIDASAPVALPAPNRGLQQDT